MAGFVAFDVSHQWGGDKVTNRVAKGGARGVNRAAAELKALSVPLAPIRDAILRESAQIREAKENDSALPEATLIFDTPYAAIQHEKEEFVHPQGGQAHYVSEPLEENRGQLNAIIAKELRHAITQP